VKEIFRWYEDMITRFSNLKFWGKKRCPFFQTRNQSPNLVKKGGNDELRLPGVRSSATRWSEADSPFFRRRGYSQFLTGRGHGVVEEGLQDWSSLHVWGHYDCVIA